MADCLCLTEAALEECGVDDKGIRTRGKCKYIMEGGGWGDGRYRSAPTARGERGGQGLRARRAARREGAEESTHWINVTASPGIEQSHHGISRLLTSYSDIMSVHSFSLIL